MLNRIEFTIINMEKNKLEILLIEYVSSSDIFEL